MRPSHSPPRKPGWRLASVHGVALLAGAHLAAHAQSDGTPRTFSIVPTLSISTTLTDNVHLSSTDRQSELTTQVSPGIQITSNAGRIRGYLGYSLNALLYARTSENNAVQHALNAAATIEAVENQAFIDLAASISQQAISAFGTQSRDNSVDNANRTAVSTYSIAPYVRGRLGSFADYEARVTYIASGNSSGTATGNATTSATARVNGATGLASLGWSVDASRQSFNYDSVGTVNEDLVHGVLTYVVTPELRVSLTGGREYENFGGAGRESHGSSGWGVDWSPTERTRLAFNRERRFFGNSHNFSFEHRTPRTVWRYVDSRGLTTGFSQLRLASLGTVYDLFFAQFASLEPDPVARAILVNAFLRSNGIAPNTVVLGGSLASTPLVQRTQELSAAWSGLRDTLTLAVSQSQGERAGPDVVVVGNDDFANGNVLRQRGVSIGYAHRLTPHSALNATLASQNTSGSTDLRSSRLRMLTVGWSSQAGGRTTFSLNGRHARFDGSGGGYTESALTAAVMMQF